MWSNRSLFASVASRLAVGLAVGCAGQASASTCPATLADAVGPEVVAKLRAKVEAMMPEQSKGASLGPTPDEVVATAQETIPNMVRGLWLDPANPYPVVTADAYAGDNIVSASPDVFALPGGARAVCHLLPGVAVFLSDGSTFHYAPVADVDYAAETVTLADPWAKVSFLRKGFNQADVAGEVSAAPDGTPRMRLSFADFAKVFRGQIDTAADAGGFAPQVTFDTLARVYPELAANDDFLFWRYSRLISQLNGARSADVLTDLGDRTDLDTKPGLKLLADAAVMLLAIRTNYGVLFNLKDHSIASLENQPDTPERQETMLTARDSVFDRLPAMAKAFPTVLMLQLIESARASDDLVLRNTVADTFLEAHPDDLDLMIFKAEALLDLEQADEAQAVLAKARIRWTALIGQVVATQAGADPVTWFEEHSPKLHLVTFNLMHWRRARIELLDAIAKAGPGKPVKLAETLSAAGKSYDPTRSHGLAYDFPGLMLRLSWRTGELDAERGYIANAIDEAPDGPTRVEIARALMDHVRWRHGLKDLLGGGWETARGSWLKLRLCERVPELPRLQLIKDAGFAERREEIDAFCQ